jgi:glutaredoxin
MKAKGIAEVIVYCCDNGAVMKAWAKDQGVEGSMITFMADPHGSLSKSLGVAMEHPGPIGKLGSTRCQRFAMYVEDGMIKAFEVAATPDDPAGDAKPDVSLVENMLSKVPELAPHEKEAAFASIDVQAQEDVSAATAAIQSAELVLFTKPGCPFCKGAFEALQNEGYYLKIIEATRSQKRGLQNLTGKTSLPSFWVHGTYCGGCDDGIEAWHGVKTMVASGALQKMLGESVPAANDRLIGA